MALTSSDLDKLRGATDAQLRRVAAKRAPSGPDPDPERYAAILAEMERRSDLQKTTQPQSRPSGLLQRAGDIATAINQGITLGFGDEITGLLGALGSIGSDESFGDRYTRYRDASRQSLRDLNPVARAGLEMTGGLLSGSAALGTGRQLMGQVNRMLPQQVQQFAPKVAPRLVEPMTRTQAATTGAGAGGIAGVGASERPLSDPEIGTDAVFGAAFGGGLNAATFLTPTQRQQLATQARSLLGQAPTAEFGRRARREVNKAMKGDELTPAMVSERLSTMPPGASLLDVGAPGGTIKELGEGIVVGGGPAAAKMNRVIRGRKDEAPARVDEMLSELMGNPSAFYKTKDELEQKMKADSAPLYEQFRRIELEMTPALEDVIDRLDAAKAGNANILDRGRRLMYASGELKVPGKSDKPELVAGKGDEPVINATVLDGAKQHLDSLIAAAIKNGDGPTARAFTMLNNDLKKVLDDQSGGLYKRARDAYAGPAGNDAALEAGRKFMRKDPEEIQFTMRDFETDTERQMFRLGAARAISDRIGNRATTQRVGKELDAPNFVKRVKELFPDQPGAYDQIRKAFDDEDDMFDTFVQLIQNSATIRRESAKQRANIAADIGGDVVADVATGQTGGLLMRALRFVGNRLTKTAAERVMQQTDAVKSQIADILLNGTPIERQRMITLLNSDLPITAQPSAAPGLLGIESGAVPAAIGIQSGLLVGRNN